MASPERLVIKETSSRRLYPRFRIHPSSFMFHFPDQHPLHQLVEAHVLEVSRDSLTCSVPDVVHPGKAEKVYLKHPSHPEFQISGEIISTNKQENATRVGMIFPGVNLLSFFEVGDGHTNDKRVLTRGTRTSGDGAGNRQYERRGFWPGFLNKRFFSEHARYLKNRDEYFFMKPLESGTGPHVVVDGREMIMMSSNNYLGLSVHPRVKEAAKRAIDKYGSSPSASSLLGGTLDIHLELEEALARFKGTEAAVTFSAGYTTNLTTLLTIIGKGDAVFYDDKNHASLMDGARLSGATGRAYLHKNAKDLERKIMRSEAPHKLVVTDTVFSMDGDTAPLPDLYRICKRQKAALMVDEAHAIGVYGKNGRGLLEHYGMEGKPDIIMGTLSKSLSGIGGYICGSSELITILKHTARAFVFSAAIPPCICAAVLECLKIIQEEPERREKLWRNTLHMREGLRAAGFNTGESETPIIPVIFPTEEQTNFMTRGLREAGIYVTPAIYPAVKKNATRVRTTIMATHSDNDIERALNAFRKVRGGLG